MQAYSEAIIAAGAVTRAALEEGLTTLMESGAELYDLAEQLPQVGISSEFLLARDLAQHLGHAYMGDLELELYATAHPQLSRQVCVDYGVLCVSDGPRDPLPMVVTNPLDHEVLSYISELVGASLKLSVASPSDLLREIDNCYGPAEMEPPPEVEPTVERALEPVEPSELSRGEGERRGPSLETLRCDLSEGQVSAQQAKIGAFLELLSAQDPSSLL